MPNFIVDNTSLASEKSLFISRPDVPIDKKIRPVDWNQIRQALVDTQSFCRGAPWLGMTEQAADPAPAGIDTYFWVRDDQTPFLHTGGIGGSDLELGGGSEASLVLAEDTTPPGDFDVSTLGTIDWHYADGVENYQPWGNRNEKRQGGHLSKGFMWSRVATTVATDTRAWINTWTAADNANGTAHAGTKDIRGLNANSLNLGYRFMFPCSPIARILRWQGTHFGAIVTHRVTMVDSTLAAPVSAITTSTSFVGYDYRMKCTFSGPRGSWIIVDSRITTLDGANNHIYVGAIGVSES